MSDACLAFPLAGEVFLSGVGFFFEVACNDKKIPIVYFSHWIAKLKEIFSPTPSLNDSAKHKPPAPGKLLKNVPPPDIRSV